MVGCHLGFGNCQGLGQGKICRGSRHEEVIWARGGERLFEVSQDAIPTPLCLDPLPVKHPTTIQDDSIENLAYRAFLSKIAHGLRTKKSVVMIVKVIEITSL